MPYRLSSNEEDFDQPSGSEPIPTARSDFPLLEARPDAISRVLRRRPLAGTRGARKEGFDL
jgi:hypothetical protein